MRFKKYLNDLAEETTAGDIAGVESKLDTHRRPTKHLQKGKKCKKHKRLNCQECQKDNWDDDQY